jgi:Ca-activated chloride channel homolog
VWCIHGCVAPSSRRCSLRVITRALRCAPLCLVLWAAMGAIAPVLAADPPPHELVAEGNKALANGNGAKAMELYDKAATQAQDSPEIAYNQGVVYYRGSDYDKAADRFSKALSTSDTNLDAKARFNLGNCAYASALKVKDKPKEAIEKLKKASDFFQDVLESHPDDKDARGNLERAQLLIKQLKEEEKKPPESQPQSQPESQPQSQPSSQPTSRPQSQPQSQPSSRPESQPSQGEQKDKDKKQGQDKQGEKKDGQEQQGEQKDAQQKDAEKKDAQQAQGDKKEGDQDKDKQEQAQAIPATQQAMSKEEAQRLLQLIRDKQRQRMEELERRERSPMQPVDKDW